MESGCSLKAYNAKYWKTYNEILNCPTNLAIAQYKRGLLVGHRLRDSLTMYQPTTMESLIQQINKHIRVEDDAASATEKANPVTTDRRVAGKVHSVGQEDNNPNNRSKDQRHGSNRDDRNKGRRNDRADTPRDAAEDAKRKLKPRTGITTVFKIPIYRILSKIRGEPFVRWPTKLGSAQRGFNSKYRCTFHEERGHRTEDCLPLKQHFEELVAAGHLVQYIDVGMKVVPSGQAEPNGLAALDVAPQGVINVIHGIIEPARVCELRGMIKKAEHMREVLSVQPTVKKGKTEEKDIISFSSKDLERIQMPHNDALVVTLRVKGFDIKRILIDQGSSVEIMYYDAFKQMKLEDKDLAPATSPLVGFNSQPEWPIEKIILPVRAGSVVKQVEFWVLKVSSIYNLILGRGWLHAIQAVASTFHQVMRFPAPTGQIAEVWGDQVMAKQ
ncbi:uncharacterized protein LOC114295248 [Camellia sinensis]|uniref:uncharacterized protein LOC114295248 n=1 Tax=Camellia sinensis TaxID=4442 RepID=UPI001035A566|nr:uncharacterized protein LOC114295248 [Camellia sinensis]